MSRFRPLLVSLGLLVVPMLAGTAHGASPGGRPLTAALNGANEVPGPGDPDGVGRARLTLNSGRGTIGFVINVRGIAPVVAAHIHRGNASSAGPVVVNFQTAQNGLRGVVSASRALIKEIRKNPGDFYVNVHTAEFLPGAIRGQLSK